MLDTLGATIGAMTARLKDVVEAEDVTLDVFVGGCYGVTDARLRSEVHHNIETVGGKELINESPICNATLNKHPAIRRGCRLVLYQLEAVAFKLHIVVGTEVIETHDSGFAALFQKASDEVGTNKTCSSSNKYSFHHANVLVLHTVRHLLQDEEDTLSFKVCSTSQATNHALDGVVIAKERHTVE